MKILICVLFHNPDEFSMYQFLIHELVLESIFKLNYLKDDINILFIDSTNRKIQLPYNFIDNFNSIYSSCEIINLVESKFNNVPYLRNIGISKAILLNCDYIFYVDSDVVLHKNTLSNLIKIADSDNNIFTVGQIYLNSIKDEGFIYGIKRKYANFSTIDKKEIIDTHGIGMGATILRISLIDIIGRFNENVSYIEDLNLNKRANRLGYRTILDKRNPLIHKRKWGILEVMRINYYSGKAELVNMMENNTWKSELRSFIYWFSLLLSIPFTLINPIPLLIIFSVGYIRYFFKAKGIGRLLLFPVMFLSKVPKVLGLIRGLLS